MYRGKPAQLFPTATPCHCRHYNGTIRERHGAPNQHLAHRESGGLRPDVPVVSADDGVLHHLGGHQLVVHVRLPRHLAAAAARKVEAKTGWTIEAAVEDGGGRGDGG